MDYTVVEMTEEELEEERVVFGGLADSVRDLADASLRTTVPADVVAEVQAEIERLTARLREEQIPGAFGVSLSSPGIVRGHGNAVVGLRNPIAPPLEIERSDEGRAWSAFHLGALYEGPPGMVHGGVAALVLDQVLGEAAAAGGSPGMTGHADAALRAGNPARRLLGRGLDRPRRGREDHRQGRAAAQRRRGHRPGRRDLHPAPLGPGSDRRAATRGRPASSER